MARAFVFTIVTAGTCEWLRASSPLVLDGRDDDTYLDLEVRMIGDGVWICDSDDQANSVFRALSGDLDASVFDVAFPQGTGHGGVVEDALTAAQTGHFYTSVLDGNGAHGEPLWSSDAFEVIASLHTLRALAAQPEAQEWSDEVQECVERYIDFYGSLSADQEVILELV